MCFKRYRPATTIPLYRSARFVHSISSICSSLCHVSAPLPSPQVDTSRKSCFQQIMRRSFTDKKPASMTEKPTIRERRYSSPFTLPSPAVKGPVRSQLCATAPAFKPNLLTIRNITATAPTQADFDALVDELRSASLVDRPVDDTSDDGMPKAKSKRSSRRNSNAASVEARRSPTPAYVAAAAVQSKPRTIGRSKERHKPQLVVLDLNGTLCVRPKKTAKGARKAIPRPYVSAFLEYLLGVDENRQPRSAVMVSPLHSVPRLC